MTISNKTLLGPARAIDADSLGPYRRAKAFLRLIQGAHKWSATRGAGHVLIHVTTGTGLRSTDRLICAAGARCIGGGYVG